MAAARRLSRRAGDEQSRELTALFGSEVDRLAQLVDRLLSPAPPRPHAPVNIHAVLERVLRLAESDAGWAVRLVRDYAPSLPDVAGDGDRLTQAVRNLVRNAIEAGAARPEEHTSEPQSLIRITSAVCCLNKNTNTENPA